MPTIISRGAFSGKAFGLTGQTTSPVYVEDVFSTYLYTGNGSTQTITNNIDLATKGGLVWLKSRSAADYNSLSDTTMPSLTNFLVSSLTNGFITAGSNVINSYNTNGFTLNIGSGLINQNGGSYVSWTFRKQPKFFDVQTFNAPGFSNVTVNHNLGSVPGMVIIKSTSNTSNWYVWHKSIPNDMIYLNTTGAKFAGAAINTVGSTSFIFDGANWNVGSNTNWISYIFADQAGGFGLSGSDSVVACGSFTTDGSGNIGTINLGWEPQYILCKTSSAVQSWFVFDTMRGWTVSGAGFGLQPNTASAELDYFGGTPYLIPTATGFSGTGNFFGANTTVIYLAIRRGPMKVPTSATSVFTPFLRNGTNTSSTVTGVGFPIDFVMAGPQTIPNQGLSIWDRLRGINLQLRPSATNGDTTIPNSVTGFDVMDGFKVGPEQTGVINYSSWSYINYAMRRAPSFFDEVCYTGTGSATTQAHNLGVAPELMIVKSRSAAYAWWCYSSTLGNSSALLLNDTSATLTGVAAWNSTNPTTTTISLGATGAVNVSGGTFVAYLFATCPGVSKVGSYTGTSAAQNIDCGFSAGARFILIKRTDSTGDWYTYDSARGISSGNDPYLLLNTTAADVTGTNYVDTFASGFTLTATAPAGLNANGGSYIFLAIS